MKASNPNVILKRNRKQASFPPPEEIIVIQDDNITVPHIPEKGPSNLSKDREESDSM